MSVGQIQTNAVMKRDCEGDTKCHDGHHSQQVEIHFPEACEAAQLQEKTHHHSSKMTNDETSEESTHQGSEDDQPEEPEQILVLH